MPTSAQLFAGLSAGSGAAPQPTTSTAPNTAAATAGVTPDQLFAHIQPAQPAPSAASSQPAMTPQQLFAGIGGGAKPTPPQPGLLRDAGAGLVSGITGLGNIAGDLIDTVTNPDTANVPDPMLARFGRAPVLHQQRTGITAGSMLSAITPNVIAKPAEQLNDWANATHPQTMAGEAASGVGGMVPFIAGQFVPGAGEADDLSLGAKALMKLREAGMLGLSGAGSGVGQSAGAAAGQQIDGKTGAAVGSLVGSLAGGVVPFGAVGGIKAAAGAVDRGMAESMPLTQSQKAANIAMRLKHAGVDMPSVAAKIDENNLSGLGGVRKTTAQATNDSALAKFTFVARNDPRYQGPLNEAAQAQNAARVGAVQDLPSHAISPEQVGNAVKAHFQGLQSQGAVAEQNAQSAAESAARSIGHPVEEPLIGEKLRNAVLKPAFDTQHAAASKLFDAIDPDGRAALDVSSGRETIDQAINDRQPGEEITGPESAMNRMLDQWQDTVPFGQAKVFRTALNKSIASSQGSAKYRLRNALSAFDDMVAGNAAGIADKPSIMPPSVGQEGDQITAPTEAFTPAGRSIGTKYVVRDIDDLITSHNADGEINPTYPQEIQPRDRSRAASVVQINKMASDIRPQMLGYSHSTTDGAPIIGPDGVVESGNGRVLGIGKAYDLNQDGAARYRDWLDGQGFDTAGFDKPVLVRERTTPLQPDERAAFARESNQSPLASMSRSEQAFADAKQLTSGLLENLRPGSPLSIENRSFVQQFIKNVASPAEAGAFLTRDGDLSIDGANRIKSALLARAYPEDPGLIESMTESDDPDTRALANGLMEGAPAMARMHAAIEAGHVPQERALAPAVKEALRIVRGARRSSSRLADVMAQSDAFEQPSELSQSFLKMAYGDNFTKRVARERVGTVLSNYANSAIDRGAQADMFGNSDDPIQLLKEATLAHERSPKSSGVSAASARRVSSLDVGSREAGVGGRPDRSGVSEGVEGGARQDIGRSAEIGNDGTVGSRKPAEAVAPSLKPNWTPEHASRYEAARQKWSDHAARWWNRSSPLSRILKKDYGRYRLSDEEVASKVLNAGSSGARDYQTFRDAVGGDGEAHKLLEQHLVNELHKDGVVQNGTVDAKKYATFSRKWGSRLKSFPVLKSKFDTAANAQAAVGRVARESNETLKSFQVSSLGRFLGEKNGTDVARNVLSQDPGTAATEMRNINRQIGQFPAARDSWREAVAQHVVDRFTGDGRGIIARPLSFVNFVRSHEVALREALGPQATENMKAVAGEMIGDMKLDAAGKARGISDTAQLQAAMRNNRPAKTTVGKLIQFGGSKIGQATFFGTSLISHGVSAGVASAVGSAIERGMVDNGIKGADDLLARSLADPVLFKQIAGKVPTTDAAARAWGQRFVRAASVANQAQIARADQEARKKP